MVAAEYGLPPPSLSALALGELHTFSALMMTCLKVKSEPGLKQFTSSLGEKQQRNSKMEGAGAVSYLAQVGRKVPGVGGSRQ